MAPGESVRTMELVRRIADECRLTVLFCEHDMDVVFGTADRILVMHQGMVLVDGTSDEVRDHPDVRKVYLGEDADVRLLGRLKELGLPMTLAEQNHRFALKYAGRAYLIEKGQIRHEASASELTGSDALQRYPGGVGAIRSRPREWRPRRGPRLPHRRPCQSSP